MAAPVADLAQKPVSIFTYVEVEDRARVVAHLSKPLPARYLADARELAELLRSEMHYGVALELETEVVAGSGLGEHLTGVDERRRSHRRPVRSLAGRGPSASDHEPHGIGERPTALVINPADSEGLALLRGRFRWCVPARPGDQAGSATQWGLPLVETMAVPVGYGICADWAPTRLFVREGGRLDLDTSGESFQTNAVTMRFEEDSGSPAFAPRLSRSPT